MPKKDIQSEQDQSVYERIQSAIIRAGCKMADLPAEGAHLSIDRRSRLLAWTMVLLFGLMVLTVSGVLLFESGPLGRRVFYSLIPTGYMLILAVAFLFNRNRMYHPASLLTVLGGSAMVWLSVLFDPEVASGKDPIPLLYIAFPIFLGAFLLKTFETVFLSLIHLSVLVWLIYGNDTWTQLNDQSVVFYIVFIFVLSMGIHFIIDADMTQIDQQNKRLLEQEASLKDLAIRDSLTHLYNRYYLDETLPREISRVKRRNGTLAIIMIDVDYFKRINDHYGHAAGDEYLRLVGQILAGKIRDSDIACRYGGDEFALIMPDTSYDAAFERAESIRKDTENWVFQIGGSQITSPTVSCGVALFPEHGQTGEDILEKADRALYTAKQNGRNQTRTASADSC